MMRLSLLTCGVPLWTLLLSGCTKTTGPTLVEGQVVVTGSEQPLPAAQVQVWGQTGTGLNAGYGPVGDPHSADAQGHFSFSFEAQANTHYVLRAGRDPGYQTNWGCQAYVEEGQKNKGLRLAV